MVVYVLVPMGSREDHVGLETRITGLRVVYAHFYSIASEMLKVPAASRLKYECNAMQRACFRCKSYGHCCVTSAD